MSEITSITSGGKSKNLSENSPLILRIPKTYGAVLPYYNFLRSTATSIQNLTRTDSMASLCYRTLTSYILEDNLAGLSSFLENKQIQIDEKDENGTTALILAAIRGHNSIVRLLISHGADVNISDLDGWTALLCASKEGHTSCVETLLDSGSGLEHRDCGGWTSLMWASYKGHLDTVIKLLERGADVNAHGNFHISSLLWASGRGFDQIVSELVFRQAKVNVGDKYGTTALIWAARKGYTNICNTLLKAGANVDTQGMFSWTALLVATQGNYFDVVQLLLEFKPNVNALDKDGCTALTIACKEGFYDIAVSLLTAGAYINIQDRMGDTNLIHAVKGNHRGIVEALLKKYADIDVCGKDRKTAIYSAVEKGNIQIVKLLLNANPDLEICTKDGDTPILRAVRSRNAEIVQLLLDKRSKVSATDKKGDTCLHIAMRARSKAIVEILLRNPKNSQLLYRPNKAGETAYNIDLNHQKQILGQIFGARRLNTNEDNENMLGYDLYSSALADMLSEPSLSMPITVGLYAKWGSGKSFLLNKLRDEMQNFARQWVDPIFHFTSLLFLVILHTSITVGTILGVALYSWLLGTISAGLIFFIIYLFLGIVWYLNQKHDFDWPYNLSVSLTRKLNSLKLLLQVTFCHPPGSNSSENVTQPIRFYFSDQTRVSSTTGGENTVVQMLGSLYDSIEQNYGAFTTRLFRAFRPKSQKGSTWKFRRLCCIPYVVVFEVCYVCFLIGICSLAIYFKIISQEEIEILYLNIILITVAFILGTISIANLYTWAKVFTSLIYSQRSQLRRAISKLDTLKSEGFQQALSSEVALLRDMVRCLDLYSNQQTRLVVIVDGLDSCEQDKVLLVLDAVHMLFSDANSPFLVILAIDPHVISKIAWEKAVEVNNRRLFNQSNIAGHDYLRNLVHLPFFLQNSGLRKVKVAQQTSQNQHRKNWDECSNILVRSLSNRRLSTESALMSSSEKLKPPTANRKGSKKLKLSDSIASSIGSNLNIVVGAHDLTKMLLTDDYFSDVNPRSMRRLMNVVYVTGRLLKAFQVEFNWYHLASWINITEQWPYRSSWLVLHFEMNENEYEDNMSLKTLYDKVRPKIPTLKEIEPLLEMDRDEKKFDIFLTFHRSSLLISDLKIFLPFTINLDPYIKKVIKEEYHNNHLEEPRSTNGPIWGAIPEWQTPRQRKSSKPVLRAPIPPQQLYNPNWSMTTWPEYTTAPHMAPVTTLPAEVLETKLSALNVSGVCQLFEKIEDLSLNCLSEYMNVIKKNNINGRVLLHCDLDELKKVLKMNFGDWELFKVLIVTLREHEIISYSRLDESKIRFRENTVVNTNRERKSSNPKSEDKNRSNNKQTLMEKQVTLEEQMICGALQTLNEEACEDVLEMETSPHVPVTTLIPPSPSPETPLQQETEFVVLAGWKGSRWAPVGSGGASECSSTSSTPQAIRRANINRPNSLEFEKEKNDKNNKIKLDSDDESTPLVSELSTPSGQISSPEQKRTDETDFSPVSPLNNMTRSVSNCSTLSRQNAIIDDDNK